MLHCVLLYDNNSISELLCNEMEETQHINIANYQTSKRNFLLSKKKKEKIKKKKKKTGYVYIYYLMQVAVTMV